MVVWMRFLPVGILLLTPSTAFLSRATLPSQSRFSIGLFATKKKKKTTKRSGAAGGIKGFGSTKIAGTDRSKETREFYEQFLEQGGAGDNLKRTALGLEPNVPFDLRGVVCTRDIAKGDDIINIPYSLAINLGPEGDDPTLPALEFMRDYCTVLQDPTHQRFTYYRMLPGYQSSDSLGCTDCFSDAALEALQSPLMVEEIQLRKQLIEARWQRDHETSLTWIDGTSPVTVDHLQWAVWLITSRVLTVQAGDEGGPPCRLLIPYLDMCNHDRSSPHILTGRVGGSLKVKAGAPLRTGAPVHIPYGGGAAGNQRFLQDYGFLDPDGFEFAAQELLGKRRIQEGASVGQYVSAIDQDRALKALRATTIAEDAALLEKEQDKSMRTAIEYRLGIKKALSKYIVL